jgi:hypothetical protein
MTALQVEIGTALLAAVACGMQMRTCLAACRDAEAVDPARTDLALLARAHAVAAIRRVVYSVLFVMVTVVMLTIPPPPPEWEELALQHRLMVGWLAATALTSAWGAGADALMRARLAALQAASAPDATPDA